MKRGFIWVFCGSFLFLGLLTAKPLWKLVEADPGRMLLPPADGVLLDRNGETYLTLPESRDSDYATFEELPDNLVKAVVAQEDRRFWWHPGWDPMGFTRALKVRMSGGRLEGGSTISMQLVEDVYDTNAMTDLNGLQIKAFEAAMAIRGELHAWRKLGSHRKAKEAILANFLNYHEFGYGTKGVKQAAKVLIQKPFSNLTLGECAHLVTLVSKPSSHSAHKSEKAARDARDVLIDLMERQGVITPEEALHSDFRVPRKTKPLGRRGDGFTAQLVREQIAALERDGSLPKDTLKKKGIEIFLTLDASLQTRAQQILQDRLKRLETGQSRSSGDRMLNGAIVAIDDATGGVLTVVGGRSFDAYEFNCATQGARPMASSIKPLVYARYMDAYGEDINSTLPNTPVFEWDAQQLPGNLDPHEPSALSPRGTFRLREGLVHSSNTMAIRAGGWVGWDAWKETAHLLRIDGDPYPKSSDVFIGNYPVSPWRATAAFSAIARGGSYIVPYLISEVRLREGNQMRTLYVHRPEVRHVFSLRSCAGVHTALQQVLLRGTASPYAKRFGKETGAAGKTGTSKNSTDTWFIGYTDSVTIGTWIGYPDSSRKINSSADGASVAYPVFEKVARALPDVFAAKVRF